ncbi:Predicted arabinose efflux permease, MFS family [Amycolatopsis arida]|uniref:Predicted arabinose efflux permease, MFS family n=1 Tax=Amycolatopsis arida TaxID=587909 RepID=A0A1I5WTV8_9PSEU|nr:MFS transporter [Amycolatopsis arida]TDX92451.1 putative MFS family arabinose efflux permease [Amycolatopsis arida]SFQ23202.1 Predicted arabinose efflux permease, MFS family [Amycolatopsis arida]
MTETSTTTPTRGTTLPREIWVLVGASFLIAIGYGLIAPALPNFAVSFDVGVTAASVVVSAFAFVRLAFAPLSGRMVTRFGERPVYLWGLLIVAAGTLATAAAVEYWQLLLFRSLSGVGSTMFTVSAVGLLIRIAPPHLRGRASGLWGTSFLLGGIAGPIVGSGLVAVSLRAPFLAYGLALLLTTAFVWWQLRRSTLVSRADEDGEPVLTFRQALRHRTYRAALASNFANGWVVFGVRMSLIPLFVTAVLLRGEEFTGVALAVFAAANAAVLLISGRFADTRGRKPPALLGLALLAVGTVLLGQADSPWLFLVASLIAGFGSGAVNPAQNAAVADVLGAKARGGSVLAGFQMAADVGAVLGPLAAGAIAEQWSYGAAFWLTGGVAAVALVTWILATETLPRRGPGEEDHAARDAVVEDRCGLDCPSRCR